jgi:hypothetical protein
MDFKSWVAPLVADKPESAESVAGCGFISNIAGQNYLVTVGHLANNQLRPTGDWTKWADKIHLVDEVSGNNGEIKRLGEFPLFFEGNRGKRVPRFKYSWRHERPNEIMDLIMLLVDSSDPIAQRYSAFQLPADKGAHQSGAEVSMLGRPRAGFPSLSVTTHRLTVERGIARHMEPMTREGDSGGPVVDSSGLLVGMNFGGDHPEVPGALLFSPEAIEAIAASVRGVVPGWPQYAPPSTTQ